MAAPAGSRGLKHLSPARPRTSSIWTWTKASLARRSSVGFAWR